MFLSRVIRQIKKRFLYLFLWLMCFVSFFISQAWGLICIVVGSDRAWRIIVSFDQLANAATGGNEDETISSRANRGRSEGRRGWCILCRILDAIDKNHCRDAAGS